MGIAIVGCGLIGMKRSRALAGHRLVAAADPMIDRAQRLAQASSDKGASVLVTSDWRHAVSSPDVNVVIVATTNDMLASVTLGAIEAGKHVLVEKPAARNAEELRPLIVAAKKHGVKIKVGFNHRFHPALLKAHELFQSGAIGKLMFVRGRYGHGGRLGMEKEWRADPVRAGGGEMLDQGVHLIDLSRWFCGDFTDVSGYVGTFFWDMPVEDNGFALLKTADGKVAWLAASCSEWKNMFSLEIYGRDGKLQIDGLGGSYGVEKLTYYHMLPQMGPPETTTWEYPFEDDSWRKEMAYFSQCIDEDKQPEGNLDDAFATLQVVDRLYALSRRSS